MSRSEMAALRSSLPSQKKYKGRILAEKMGVKIGELRDEREAEYRSYVKSPPITMH